MGAALPANVPFFILIGILYSNCYDVDPLLAAYCQVRCLNQSNYDADCIFPCDVNITSHDECHKICHNKNTTCQNSCYFMWNSLSNGQSVECIGQGQKNHIANDMSIREIQNGRGIVHISWPHPNENVIFVVQTRWNLIDADNFTDWETLTKTTASTIILKEVLYPGRWYQFRIAVVSANGTDGFSEESKPFILSVTPKAPGPPTNLREETEDNQYPVIRWEPPFSELPIDHYQVMWVQRSPSARKKQMTPKEFRRLLPSTRLSVTLKQVEPKALFLVQVQAAIRFKNHTFFGEKASIFVNTFSLKISETKGFSDKISNLTVYKPNEIHNETFMNVNISWNWPQELQKQAIKFVVRWNVVICKNKQLNSQDVYYHSAVTEMSTQTEQLNTLFNIYNI
uniref:Fibronectin type-III domain-containing protein n=1 Tax=Strigamia maritima TaxID=126957 RepID=T1J713_STRMM